MAKILLNIKHGFDRPVSNSSAQAFVIHFVLHMYFNSVIHNLTVLFHIIIN